MIKLIKWVIWQIRLLKQCKRLIRKYPNLGFLPQNTHQVHSQDWRIYFNEELTPKEAIEEMLYDAARDT